MKDLAIILHQMFLTQPGVQPAVSVPREKMPEILAEYYAQEVS